MNNKKRLVIENRPMNKLEIINPCKDDLLSIIEGSKLAEMYGITFDDEFIFMRKPEFVGIVLERITEISTNEYTLNIRTENSSTTLWLNVVSTHTSIL